ncbi:hypothetical protein ONE63_007004 [Megalurothrips usitatus]|uniref:PAS domain-containing protein n=1 Tax=Megalurothrips usitatus TaxID=439358 RepID=A0AAV7XRP1_9NEOP|nr:hypothetical protein ONE63_007004 [Megalurothrips usitatus]
MQRAAVCDFLHGPLTSQHAVSVVREALSQSAERHFEILYYRKDGTKFLCSEVIAPVKSEADDICLYIINFEDLSAQPAAVEQDVPAPITRLSKSFRQSFRERGLRGLRLAGYLPPPSDGGVEEEDEGLQQRHRGRAESVAVPSSKPPGRSATVSASRHVTSKMFPNTSSETDLQRYRTTPAFWDRSSRERKSPSLSNVASDSLKQKFSIQDNGSAKFFQGALHTPNMGEKVAQCLGCRKRGKRTLAARGPRPRRAEAAEGGRVHGWGRERNRGGGATGVAGAAGEGRGDPPSASTRRKLFGKSVSAERSTQLSKDEESLIRGPSRTEQVSQPCSRDCHGVIEPAAGPRTRYGAQQVCQPWGGGEGGADFDTRQPESLITKSRGADVLPPRRAAAHTRFCSRGPPRRAPRSWQ